MSGDACAAPGAGISWRRRAACGGEDLELFLPVGSGPALAQIAAAKAVCARCPVRDACLRYAVTTGQGYGIWGGLTEDERRGLRYPEQLSGLPGEPARRWSAPPRVLRNRPRRPRARTSAARSTVARPRATRVAGNRLVRGAPCRCCRSVPRGAAGCRRRTRRPCPRPVSPESRPPGVHDPPTGAAAPLTSRPSARPSRHGPPAGTGGAGRAGRAGRGPHRGTECAIPLPGPGTVPSPRSAGLAPIARQPAAAHRGHCRHSHDHGHQRAVRGS